ncbi:MAG: ATP-binding protein [Bacteroidota bacterium]
MRIAHHMGSGRLAVLVVLVVGGLLGGIPSIAWAQALDPTKALTQHLLKTYTTEDGLPQSTINTILQTHDGYVWLGTQEGLARFDGLFFRVFDKRTHGLPNNIVTSLLEDRDQHLWVGTQGGGLARWDGRSFTVYAGAEGLPSGSISTLHQQPSGRLWVGSHDAGLAYLDGDRFVPLEALPGTHVTSLVTDSGGRLLIGTQDQGLFQYDGVTVTPYPHADPSPLRQGIRSLALEPEGSLLVGTLDQGVFRVEGGRVEPVAGLPADELGEVRVLHPASGALWLGTGGAGLWRVQPDQTERLDRTNGLPHGVIRALYADAEGSLWVGTDAGLGYLHDGKFTTYTPREGLPDSYLFPVLAATDGSIWMGTEQAGAARLQDGAVTTLTSADGLGSDFVMSLAQTPDGTLWLGTRGGGLSYLREGRLATYPPTDRLPGASIYALYTDRQGALWVASEIGVSVYREGVFQRFEGEAELASPIVTTFGEDAQGRLLIGTYDAGFHVIEDGRVVAHYAAQTEPGAAPSGLRSNIITTFYTDENATWIGTQEGGLHRLQGDQLLAYPALPLASEAIAQILEDDEGHLWLSSNRGLYAVPKVHLQDAAQAAQAEVVAYTKHDGLLSQEFNGGLPPPGARGLDGRLWFPSVAGLVSVDPNDLPRNTVPPPIHLEELRIDGEAQAVAETLAIPPGAKKVEFRYAGLSYLAPEQVQYRYQLDGQDDAWVEAGSQRYAYYTNLAPGAYTFRVQAQNQDGVWSETSATTSLYLQPFFYQTTWFWLLCIAVALGLAYAGYRLRVRQLKERQRHLEALVDDRTRDLREAKERTEAAKLVIEEQAEQLRELDKAKTRFFNNLSHEFRTPLTLNIGPLENALEGHYGPLSETMRPQLQIMLRNARRLLHLINQLLDLAKLESNRMELTLERGDLVGLVRGIVESFAPFAEQEGLEVRFETNVPVHNLFLDQASVDKMVFNLMSNAIKFTPPHGRITAAVQLREADQEVDIRVQDTGVGIPEDAVAHVFDRFQQVAGTSSKVQAGTGIGLSLVKELAELHGGRIQVDSTVGAGTTFTITLPLHAEQLEQATLADSVAQDRAAMQADMEQDRQALIAMQGVQGAPLQPETAAPSVVPATHHTVLVVDDNADIQEYIVRCLHDLYQVVTAPNGRVALEQARVLMPDLIISDVMMPEMDGYSLCEAIRADESLVHVPFVLLTSRNAIEDKVRGFEAGADDFVAKPFNARELRARVQNLITLHDRQRQIQQLNRDLKRTNEALREAGDTKTHLVRIVAHDLKNPLNAVREFAKILSEDYGERLGDDQELLDMIADSANQMLGMITQLLDVEALETGRIPVKLQPMSLAALVHDALPQHRRVARQKGQTIEASIDEDAVVIGDPSLLRDVFGNLISNALKYSPPGKTIWVRVEQDTHQARMAVRDEGPGLTEDDKTKLFGKFQRLSAQPTGGESSSGLGLSIVKRIIDMHEGEVQVESTYGEGSTFTVALTSLNAIELQAIEEIQQRLDMHS